MLNRWGVAAACGAAILGAAAQQQHSFPDASPSISTVPGYARPSLERVFTPRWIRRPWSWSRYLAEWGLPRQEAFPTTDSIFTRLAYFQGTRDLQYFEAAHYQRFPSVHAGIYYHRRSADAAYSQRTTRLRGAGALFGIQRRKYVGNGGVHWADAVWQENGGLASPDAARGIDLRQYASLPVRLQGVNNGFQQWAAQWNGRWRLGGLSTDSPAVQWGLIHRLELGSTRYAYFDPHLTANASYYPVIAHGDEVSSDTLRSRHALATVGLGMSRTTWHIEAGVDAEVLEGSIDTVAYSLFATPLFIGGQWRSDHWNVEAKVTSVVEGEGSLRVAWHDSLRTVWGRMERFFGSPFWWMRRPAGPHERSGAGAEPVETYAAAFGMQHRSAYLIVRGWTWRRYPYYDTLLYLRIAPRSAAAVVTGGVEWERRQGGVRAAVTWQAADASWWAYPPWVVDATGTIRWRWLRRMHSSFGVRVRHHLPYAAPAFFADRLRWRVPASNPVANYPWVEVQLTGRVDRFHLWAKAENVLFWIYQRPYWVDYWNPVAPFRLVWGVRWDFID